VTTFKIAIYRFSGGTEKSQIVTNTTPLLITAQFE